MIINPDLLSLNQITLILHLYEVCKSTQRTCKAKVFSGNEEREVLTLIRLVFLRRFFSVWGGGGGEGGREGGINLTQFDFFRGNVFVEIYGSNLQYLIVSDRICIFTTFFWFQSVATILNLKLI